MYILVQPILYLELYMLARFFFANYKKNPDTYLANIDI